VIDEVSHEEVKRKERGSEEKVVHGMKIDAAHRGDDEHEEKEEQE
jgi:hypothetical protein